MFFNPLSLLLIAILFFALLFFFVMLQINVIALAFSEMGIPSQYIFTALFAGLLGSFINIPVKRIPQDSMGTERLVRYFGIRYAIPVWEKKETVLAVNLGGAVVPVILSAYLIIQTGLWLKAGFATLIMVILTHQLARPVKGLGIALPPLFPPIIAALLSVLLAYDYAPAIAYIAGTTGTLIGADILNLKKIGNLGAPVASIGGAGTFDGIFLNGVIAVLLAALLA
jgi:uncharacterized membrane protein